MVPIIQMFFIFTIKSWVLRWQRQVEIGKESPLPVCLWQRLRLILGSPQPCSHILIFHFQRQTESQLTLLTQHQEWVILFSLAQIKMLLCPFDFHIVKWSWQWPPSCLIDLWMKFWMHFHTAIINWWVLWPSRAGRPVSVCCDAGQPPA